MRKQLKNISVIITEDHSIFTEGLCSILQNIDGIRISAAFTTAEQTLEYLKNNDADIAFLDIGLPQMSGIELCKEIKALHTDVKIIALTNHTEKSVITEMLQNGADGYLLKNTSKDQLIDTVYQVLNNRFLMSNELQKILFSPETKPKKIPRLTQREKEVLKLVSEGATTASIAKQLFISIQTVESHRHNLMQKFEVNNAALLVKKAAEFGIL